MKCYFKKYTLHFKKPGGTSRGVFYNKDTYFILIEQDGNIAIGECNRFKNLSFDDKANYEEKLADTCQKLPTEGANLIPKLSEWPSILFGVETVLKDVENGSQRIIFPEVIKESGFNIPSNGLIWMGTKENMLEQIAKKLNAGFTSIKLKIGAIDFDTEIELLKSIRRQFSADEVEVRLDANGAFSYQEAKEKLKRLSIFNISYIEQPIRAGQWQEIAQLIDESPIKIALDEELIGVNDDVQRKKLIETIRPHILILKHALIGGFQAADRWKKLVTEINGTWVVTSALESNIGLNAIAQYTAQGWSEYAQGLGTGQLFTNNFISPYTFDEKGLHFHKDKKWDLSQII